MCVWPVPLPCLATVLQHAGPGLGIARRPARNRLLPPHHHHHNHKHTNTVRRVCMHPHTSTRMCPLPHLLGDTQVGKATPFSICLPLKLLATSLQQQQQQQQSRGVDGRGCARENAGHTATRTSGSWQLAGHQSRGSVQLRVVNCVYNGSVQLLQAARLQITRPPLAAARKLATAARLLCAPACRLLTC